MFEKIKKEEALSLFWSASVQEFAHVSKAQLGAGPVILISLENAGLSSNSNTIDCFTFEMLTRKHPAGKANEVMCIRFFV